MSVEAPGSARPGETATLVARLSAEKSAALARLAAGVAHELRNPLAVIVARVQLLFLGLKSGQPLDPAKLERALGTIEEQATRAAKIIESLSIFARPRAPAIGPVDVAAAVAMAVSVARARVPRCDGVATDVQIADRALTVDADGEQLVAALAQLIVNALEAMPEGGHVAISGRRTEDGMELIVSDTGPGVALHDAPRIFEPFFSTKPGAAGLGLCVAQTIAEGHGGSVRLLAPAQVGAQFVLALPRRH